MITSPQLPPKPGYVEVEIDGMRTYRNVKTGILISDERPYVSEIDVLKQALTTTDYKIIKCSEYQLAGLEAPYDIAELHKERQEIRDKINALESPVQS